MTRRSLKLAALLAVSVPWSLVAQEATVRGRVVDSASGGPLARAVVQIGSRGALTGVDGRYVISGIPAGRDTVRVRMIGYSPASRSVTAVAGQTVDADFSLSPQAINLSEIVVTGYGTQRQGDITGAVSQLTTQEFNPGRTVSPAQLIANKAPGVQVVDNNEPGGGLSIRIRGATSVRASNEPLYVIDGMPIGTGAGGGLTVGRDPLNALNPNEIESITVLRDASAAAIYGSNAANGVVLITTKKGRESGSIIEYNGSLSTSTITRRPSMLNAEQFRAAVQQFAPQHVSRLANENTDWFSLVDQSAFGQDHNLAVSNASESNNWRLSLGYLNQNGIISGTEIERISLGFNIEQRLFRDKLNLRGNLKGTRTHDQFTPGGVLSNAAQMSPTQPVFDETSPTGFFEWSGDKLTSPDNPVALLDFVRDEATTYRSFGNVRADYQLPFLQGLKVNLDMGYDASFAERETFSPRLLQQTQTAAGGSDFRSSPDRVDAVLETYVSYAAPVGRSFGTVDVAAGYSYGRSSAEYPEYRATDLTTDVLGGNGVVTAGSTQNTKSIQESKLVSFFGRLNYNYNDKYLASLTIRQDGSSRFGEGNEWGTFPSVAIGWRLSQESFLQNSSLFSDLKLRASWAYTGNQAFDNYQQYSTYLVGDAQSQVQFGNEYVSTIRPSAVDPNIRWEATNAYNIGLDFGLWGQRVSGTLDFYTKNTDDLIFTVPVAAGTNLSNFLTTNIGSMKNKGFEFSLSARILGSGGDGLAWTADFLGSHNTNELTSINPVFGENVASQRILVGDVAGGVGTRIQVLQPGVPINSFFVYEHKRDASGKPIYEDTNGDQTINEKDLYVDRNGDGNVNVDDRRPFNDPAPKWIFGHSSYLSYRKFDFGFTLRAYTGNWVYNNVSSNLGSYAEVTRGAPYNLHTSVLETGFVQPQYLSDYYVEDASFLRMDNLTLGYSFRYRDMPIRLYGTLQNAFTVSGYDGVDPTAGINGIDNNIYPRSRTFTAGLGMRF